MFSPAGSRLPWKSFHDSTCRSVVCCRCPWFQSTATVSDSVCAPAMVTAPAGVAPTTASGAATTAASPVRISPPRTNREPSNARIMVPPLIEVSTSAHPYTAFAARGSRRVNILLSYIRRRGQPRTGPPVAGRGRPGAGRGSDPRRRRATAGADRAARAPGRRQLGHGVHRGHHPGDAVPRARGDGQRRDRRVRPARRDRPRAAPPGGPGGTGGRDRGAGLPALRAGDQPDRAHRHRGGVPRPAGDGAGPAAGQPARLDRGRPALARAGPRRPGAPGPALDPAGRSPAADVPGQRAARLPPGGRLPGGRRGRGRDPADAGTAPGGRLVRARRPADRAGAGGSGRAAGAMLRGGRVRGGRAQAVLADRAAGVPRGRSHGRRQVDRPAGRHVRPALRVAVRAADVRGRARVGGSGRLVAAMSQEVGSTTVLLVGALLVRLSLGGAYTRYVRVGMGPWLLVAGLLLAGLGAVGVAAALARPRAADPPDHQHGERVGWLLLAPVVALLMVTPPALGSFGVDRSTVVEVSSGGRTFAPLPAGGPVPMTLLEYGQRAADHAGASFGATPVRLTGFVARSRDGDGFRLARYQIQCCAADAVAAVVRVLGGTGDPPGLDTWITVTGTFQPSADGVPRLRASSLETVPAPADPYE